MEIDIDVGRQRNETWACRAISGGDARDAEYSMLRLLRAGMAPAVGRLLSFYIVRCPEPF
jgi:hypothetical protein